MAGHQKRAFLCPIHGVGGLAAGGHYAVAGGTVGVCANKGAVIGDVAHHLHARDVHTRVAAGHLVVVVQQLLALRRVGVRAICNCCVTGIRIDRRIKRRRCRVQQVLEVDLQAAVRRDAQHQRPRPFVGPQRHVAGC